MSNEKNSVEIVGNITRSIMREKNILHSGSLYLPYFYLTSGYFFHFTNLKIFYSSTSITPYNVWAILCLHFHLFSHTCAKAIIVDCEIFNSSHAHKNHVTILPIKYVTITFTVSVLAHLKYACMLFLRYMEGQFGSWCDGFCRP